MPARRGWRVRGWPWQVDYVDRAADAVGEQHMRVGGSTAVVAPPSLRGLSHRLPTVGAMVEENPPSWDQTVVRAAIEATAGVPLIGPGLSGALRVVYDDVVARRQARVAETVEDIATGAGGPQNLAARLEESPQLDAMFGRAVEAAARTGLEAKRRLLARAVVAAACDDAKLDDSELMIDTLAQLDSSHVMALARMNDEPPIPTDAGEISWGMSAVWREQPAAIQPSW